MRATPPKSSTISPFDEEAIAEQARTILEDTPVQVFKVGFLGSPEAVSTIAEIAADYADVPVIAYMPNLSWWDESQIDLYRRCLPRTDAAADHRAGGQPQHAVALAAARLEQRAQPRPARHRQGGRRTWASPTRW
jgi:hypothetical protein